MAQLPNYLMGQANGFGEGIDGLTNALYRYQDQQNRNRQMAMEQERLGLERGRFGLQEREANRAYQTAMQQEAQFNNLFANGQPAWAKQLPPGAIDVTRAMGAQQGLPVIANIMAKHPEMAMERQRLDLQNRSLAEQITQRQQMYPLEKQKVEAQLKALQAKEPEQMLMQHLFNNLNRQQGGPAPGVPRLQPQSFDGGEQPAQLIQTQAATGGPSRQAEEMINVPGLGPMPKSQAETMQFLMSKDRGQVIGDAVKKNDLGKEAANENDKRALRAVEGLARIKQIAGGFQDKWLTYENKAKQYGISWLDSFETLRSKLPPDALKEHADYTMFVRDAMSNLTEGIKDATGAAMGIQEEGRIRAGLPDPQKDSPTQFKAKLMGTARDLSMMHARTEFLRKNGFRGQAWQGDGNAASRDLPIEQFRRMIDQDGDALYRDLKQRHPQAGDDQINGAVRSQLKQRYGTNI